MQFTISEEEMASVLEASKPVPYMVFGGVEPMSPREKANRAWQAIGEAHGVEWSSIRPVNEAQRLMLGTLLPEQASAGVESAPTQNQEAE